MSGYKLLYINLAVTTSQIYIYIYIYTHTHIHICIYTHLQKRKYSKHNTKDNHPFTRENKEEERNKNN